ncbi:MAG TPA: DNA polymerase sliding clamp, partial [Thermotoga sp.]|nr:DNA polymerase sliding clamp [Thermotoga sp.]
MKVVGDYAIVRLFKGLNTVVNEAVFNFTSDGLTIRAVDPANVSMVEVEAPASSFNVYEVEEEMKIGLDVDRIVDFLKIAKKKDNVEMEHDKERNQFKIRIGSIEYQITTISPENIKEPKAPNLQLTAKATFDAGEFKRAIQCISK